MIIFRFLDGFDLMISEKFHVSISMYKRLEKKRVPGRKKNIFKVILLENSKWVLKNSMVVGGWSDLENRFLMIIAYGEGLISYFSYYHISIEFNGFDETQCSPQVFLNMLKLFSRKYKKFKLFWD